MSYGDCRWFDEEKGRCSKYKTKKRENECKWKPCGDKQRNVWCCGMRITADMEGFDRVEEEEDD